MVYVGVTNIEIRGTKACVNGALKVILVEFINAGVRHSSTVKYLLVRCLSTGAAYKRLLCMCV